MNMLDSEFDTIMNKLDNEMCEIKNTLARIQCRKQQGNLTESHSSKGWSKATQKGRQQA